MITAADVELPETFESIDASSTFSSTLTETRVEIAFANSVRGNDDAKQFCVERASQIFDGGSWVDNPEEMLPALLTRTEFTIENLINEDFVNSKVSTFKTNEYFPNKVSVAFKKYFGFDYIKDREVLKNELIEKLEEKGYSWIEKG